MHKTILVASITVAIAASASLAGAQSSATPELFQAQSPRLAAAATANVPASVNGMLRGKTAQ